MRLPIQTRDGGMMCGTVVADTWWTADVGSQEFGKKLRLCANWSTIGRACGRLRWTRNLKVKRSDRESKGSHRLIYIISSIGEKIKATVCFSAQGSEALRVLY